ncbi:MAG: hypothetical protein LBT24_06850 [Tannerella sp.]|nr:hypothetical protein [Tannerella sp.]
MNFFSIDFLIVGVIASWLTKQQSVKRRVIAIVLAIVVLHALAAAFILPSLTEYTQVHGKMMFILGALFNGRLFRIPSLHAAMGVFAMSFVKDVLFILPSVLVRFIWFEKPSPLWPIFLLLLFMFFALGRSRYLLDSGAIACAWFFILIKEDKYKGNTNATGVPAYIGNRYLWRR